MKISIQKTTKIFDEVNSSNLGLFPTNIKPGRLFVKSLQKELKSYGKIRINIFDYTESEFQMWTSTGDVLHKEPFLVKEKELENMQWAFIEEFNKIASLVKNGNYIFKEQLPITK